MLTVQSRVPQEVTTCGKHYSYGPVGKKSLPPIQCQRESPVWDAVKGNLYLSEAVVLQGCCHIKRVITLLRAIPPAVLGGSLLNCVLV